MAKKQSVGKFPVGTRVQVKPGVASPEFSDHSVAGWIGTVSEVASKKPPVTYVLEWDARTLDNMPPAYVERCEQNGLYYRMICLPEDDLDAAE